MAKKRIGFGDLFCTVCGERIEKDSDICPRCGAPYDDSKYGGMSAVGAGGVGWSDRADDPGFKARGKKNVVGMFIIMLIISAAIFAVIYFTSKMEFSEFLPIYGIVMAVIWTFWIVWLIVQYTSRKDWEGVVESRRHYLEERSHRNSDNARETYTVHVYEVAFRRNDGKFKKLTSIDSSGWYDYLSEGDVVRYHGRNMNYYEKYDKSRDDVIPCAACGMKRDARETFCGRCGAVMLKGRPAAQRQSKRFCTSCGAPSEGGLFCTKCGARLQ